MPSPLTPFLSDLSSSETLRALHQPLFVGMWVCQGVATASRTPWMGRQTPPPFTDGMPEVQGAAPYQGPRGKAGPERPRAPLAWAPSPAPPAPLAPAPAQLLGPNPGLWEVDQGEEADGDGRPLMPLGCLDVTDVALGSCLGILTGLLNCNSPWHRGAGPRPGLPYPQQLQLRRAKGWRPGRAGGSGAAGHLDLAPRGPATRGRGTILGRC